MREHANRPAQEAAIAITRHSGEPLEDRLRIEMQARFGYDFGRVRVHSGESARRAADGIDAVAYTYGDHVVLGATADRQTIAHELAHVVQQDGAVPGPLAMSQPGSAVEAAAHGQPAAVRRGSVPVHTLMRQTKLEKGYAGEQEMAFRGYRMQDGWILLEGPSGQAGHAANAPGFDGVAVQTKPGQFEIHLLDNKALKRGGNVRSATALVENLSQNINRLITRVSAPGFNAVSPALTKQIQNALVAARTAINTPGAKLPSTVKLVVTNAVGASTGITAPLAARGVTFRNLNALPPPTTPPASAPPTAAPPAAAPPAAAAPTAVSRPATVKPPAASLAEPLAKHLGEEAKFARRAATVAKVAKTSLLVLSLLGELHTFFSTLDMAQKKLAGGAFLLDKELTRARKLAKEAENLGKEYTAYHEKLTTWKWQLVQLAGPGEAKNMALAVDSLNILGDLENLISDIDTRLRRLEKLQKLTEAREKAAETLLESGVIGAGGIAATVFAAYEDLGHINAALTTTHGHLNKVREAAVNDKPFFVKFIRLCRERIAEAQGGTP